MKRNSTPSFGAFHPIFFILMVYFISVALAIFVCTTIYNSMHATTALDEEEAAQVERFTARK
jgi:hypothetical protein